ncbi:hypothetical protein [Zestomonas carbonaria]|uniref:Uncharacterized protein n=1 Tax=Zestomonas carbonaria TaxID=2762745 RepID=A0A7U7EL53_9GAMM|nr:hypothetical protein [Pseudomonas carbonaria]CAD5107024.1 hypothetical protein PSEWESI4_01295 [Pseudomonas carbonaria]
MHTLIATLVGLLFLGCVILIGRAFGLGRQTVAWLFVVPWLVACLVHGAIGLTAGQTLVTEMLVFLVVFGVPLAVLWWIGRVR